MVSQYLLRTTGFAVLAAFAVACGGNDALPEPSTTATLDGTPVPQVAAPRGPSPTPYSIRLPFPIVITPTPDVEVVETAPVPLLEVTVAPAGANATPVPEPPVNEARNINCGDFDSRQEAQEFFENSGGPLVDQYDIDVNRDGVACNAAEDSGIELARYSDFYQESGTATPVPTATPSVPDKDCDSFDNWEEVYEFFISEGGPESDPHRLDPDKDGVPCTALKNEESYTPTPTPEFVMPAGEVWQTPERTEELNSVDWHAFNRDEYGFGVYIAGQGEKLTLRTRTDVGELVLVDVECSSAIGNRLDDGNPTYDEMSHLVFIWVQPIHGADPFCAQVDRYRRWLPDNVPVPWVNNLAIRRMPAGIRGQDMEFTAPGDTERRHTRLPANPFDLDMLAEGGTWNFEGQGLMCSPRTLPVAVWTDHDGFQQLGTDEEELLASYSLNGSKPGEYDEDFYASYDWASKEHWRGLGWYFVLYGWDYDTVVDDHWKNDVRYIYPSGLRAGCWGVPNVEDIPGPRYCLECERRERMAAIAEASE